VDISARKLPFPGRALVGWIWHKPDGMRYLRPLAPKPRLASYWLRSMSISPFSAWREVSREHGTALAAAEGDGLWDFGSHIARIQISHYQKAGAEPMP
jgi:hypothetical protein